MQCAVVHLCRTGPLIRINAAGATVSQNSDNIAGVNKVPSRSLQDCRPEGCAMYKNVLVPIAADHDAKAEYALKAAKALRAKGGKIILFHVIDELPAYILAQIPAEIVEKGHKTMRDEMTRLAKLVGGNVEIDVISGHASRTILEYAEEKGVDCIVIASHKPGLEDYFLGSTASRVVRHAICSVHVLR